MIPYTIKPPASEVTFESLCLALLKRHWSRPGLERFAKKGEEQFGVDIFDTYGESPLYAAQCKLKEQWKSLERNEIRTEVAKAETFPSKLDHYAILTTGKISGASQLEIQAINQEHRAAGLFTVELFTWEKLTELIRQYPEIEQQFFGGFRADEVAKVNSKLDQIATLTESVVSISATSEIDALIDEARTRITPSEAQIAVLLLNRIQRTKGNVLSDWHRFRIFTNLGAASLLLGKSKEAAQHFLDAKPFRPEDELAIANEVLAYHLLFQEEETRERSAAAVNQFPNSTRLRSLWIQSRLQTDRYQDLVEATPGHMLKDAEVAAALCRSALAGGLIDNGIARAKDAVQDKPKWSQAHLLLAQAYFGRIAMAERTITPLTAEDRETTFAKSLAAADEAISISKAEGESYVMAQALALKSDIALTQGRKEDAARFARESFGADSTELHGRMSMALAAITMGHADEGIRILEEVYVQAESGANVSFMLGRALMIRGTEHDAIRAFEVFSNANVVNLARELIDPIVIGAIRALIRADRWDEILAYVARPEVAVSQVLVATANAYVALKQSLHSEASQWLDKAISLRQPTDTPSATDFLARALLEAGRLSDALPLLQELFNVQTPNFDVDLLLNCASRLKQDKVILDTCQALYDRGEREWRFQEFESQYLEEYNYPKAISRLQEFIAANPNHRIARLRLAIVSMRYGQKGLSQVSETTLPPPEDLPMRYAVAAILLLQWQGQGRLAVDYAYRLLRAHTSELEAYKAYLASLISGSRPNDIPATMDTVEVGSAVQYSEGFDLPSAWFVLEDTNDPNSEFEELPASSHIAKELLGKKVGDSFVLAKSSIQDRTGKIIQILSKYTRRFQAIGDQMQLKFGEQSVIQTMRVPPPERLTAADLQPMLDSVKAKSEAVSKLREMYKSRAMPIHMYGAQMGHSAYEGLFDLAISENDYVRCAPPQLDVLARAMATLGTTSTVILDLTALATLRLLGITQQVLTCNTFRYVISSDTFVALQQLRAETLFSSGHGTLKYENGQHYMTEISDEESEKQRTAYEKWMTCIEENVTVSPVPEVAALTPERRETLEKLFGRYGLESAVMALSPGHILWTDDFVLAEVGKSELGVQRVWTQAIVEHLANRGLLDRTLADEAYAKLIGFDYHSTHFTGAVMLAALRVSKGFVDAFPMRQMIRVFEPLFAANRRVAFQLIAEFFVRLAVEPMLPETKCAATKAFLNSFPGDAVAKGQLSSFRVQCALLMSRNPRAQANFIQCFDQWHREKLTLNPFVNPFMKRP
jgi:hypothetical protein